MCVCVCVWLKTDVLKKSVAGGSYTWQYDIVSDMRFRVRLPTRIL